MKLHTHVVQTLIKLYKNFKNPKPYKSILLLLSSCCTKFLMWHFRRFTVFPPKVIFQKWGPSDPWNISLSLIRFWDISKAYITKSSSQRNQALHDNSFAVTGPRLWNVIPTHMHTIEDPMQFKAALTNFVKSFPDEPPAPGYSRRNVNYLLDWSGDKTVSTLSGGSTFSMAR